MKKKWNRIKNIVLLQLVIVIYTFSGVMAKLASSNKENLLWFLTFFVAEFVILGVYAVLWQQIIKRFDLTVAYANRAMAILWSMIWAYVFFHEQITAKNILGVVIVLIGTVIMNTDKGENVND